MSITAGEARARLVPLIEQVNDDAVAIEIVSTRGSAFLVPAELWSAMVETEYLLRSPANAEALHASVRQARDGKVSEQELVDPKMCSNAPSPPRPTGGMATGGRRLHGP